MATRPPTKSTVTKVIGAPRRSRVKLLVCALLGVLLGSAVVFFLARVYNPFESGIEDDQLLALAPGDADLLVFIPRVAKFLGGMRDRPFSRRLADDPGFQQFLRSDYAKKKGALEGLSDAFREIDMMRARPPLGLDLWEDIAGQSLLFAGYAPTRIGDPWQFIAMFRPNSWKVIAAVNVLNDSLLGDLGPVQNGLKGGGVKRLDRYRDAVTLTFEKGPALALTRIRNVVVVGTETDRLTRLKTTIERDRIPTVPPARYADLSPRSGGSPYEVRAVVRRSVADAQLHVTRTLHEEWGRDQVQLLEASIPRFTGEDLLVTATIDDALDLRLRVSEGAPMANDLARSFRTYDREEASIAFGRVAPLLPQSTFAFAHLSVDVAQFLDAFFKRGEIFSRADHSNLADALKSVPELGDVDGLKNKLAQICEGRMSLGFFKQDRDVLDKPAAGAFVAFNMRDEAELRRLLAAIEARIRQRAVEGAQSVVRDLVRYHRHDVDLYEIVLPEGVVNDPRVTKLGLVIGRNQLVVTNFIPSFRVVLDAPSLDGRILPAEPVLMPALDQGPASMRVACSIAGEAIYEFFDQSAEGWSVERTTPSGAVQHDWSVQAQQDALKRGLQVGTPEFDRYVDDAFQRRLDEIMKIKRPEARREIDRYLGYFRGLVKSLALFIGEGDGIEIGLRVELDERRP